METLILAVVPLLGAVLTGFIGAFFHKANKKLDMEMEDTVVDQAVSYAEEAGRAYVAKRGKNLPSNDKLDLAVNFALAALPKAKTDAFLERLKKKIESRVWKLFHWDK